MAERPGIIFRHGPAGRRPGLADRSLDIWEIIETVHHEEGNISAAAEYLSLSRQQINTAVDYYLDHTGEIDSWIQRNAELSQEAEAASRRRQDMPPHRYK